MRVRGKEEVLAACDEEAKERCMEGKRKVSKKKVNEQFQRKMEEDMNGNMKLFWKEVSNAKGG